MNVQMRVHVLRTFVTHLLVHMHQKEKITLEIAAKIASTNNPLVHLCIFFTACKPLKISDFQDEQQNCYISATCNRAEFKQLVIDVAAICFGISYNFVAYTCMLDSTYM